MSIKYQILNIKNITVIACVFVITFSLVGCEAFVRKFTRKPKKKDLSKEEMVLVPEEYKGPQMTKEELYRKYFLYWKSWQDELISALIDNRSSKKKIDCLEEALENLMRMRDMLNQEKRKKLEIYITRMKQLQSDINRDLYGMNNNNNRQAAEHIKMDILKDFSYNDIKDYLL